MSDTQVENIALNTRRTQPGHHSFDDVVAADQNATISSPPSESSLSAYLTVLAAALIFTNIWGFTFIFGIFQSFYETSLLTSESPSNVSWIGTIQSALLVIVGVISGPLYDQGGLKWMMISGSTLILVGLFMLSLSTQYYQVFLTQGLAVGVGGGLLYMPTLALVSGRFARRRALALGVVTCGIGLGGMIYVAAFQSLLPQLGFPWTVRVIAFMALAIFAIAVPTIIYTAPTRARSLAKRKLLDSSAFQDIPFMVYAITSFLIFLGYLVPFFYIPSYGESVLGLSRSTSFWALAISSASSIGGRLGSALSAQRLGTMVTWVGCGISSAVLCFAWIAITSDATFLVFAGLYGFFSGGLVALPATIFPRICRDQNKLGTWMGMGWCLSGVSFLIGAPIAGALTSIGGENINFLPVQVWSGVLLMAGSAGLMVLWTVLVRMRHEAIFV